MKIQIGYPFKTAKTFEISEQTPGLPKFRYGCKRRSTIMGEILKKNKFQAWHAVEDFVLESIEIVDGGEIWYLGS